MTPEGSAKGSLEEALPSTRDQGLEVTSASGDLSYAKGMLLGLVYFEDRTRRISSGIEVLCEGEAMCYMDDVKERRQSPDREFISGRGCLP